jgi:uncharacterized membrane protein YjfL (UPF0719 family)
MAEVEIPNHEELEEIKKNHFSKRIALVTALYAVLLAITSLGGNNAAKEMMLAQQQSSNQWAFYQSKALREHLYRLEKKRTDALLMERGDKMSIEAKKNYKDISNLAGTEEVRYGSEKKQIEDKSKDYEKIRDLNISKDPYFDFAEALLQIAIVLSSIAILSSSLPVFYISLGSAGIGTILMINGFFLLFRIPFFH